MPTTAPDTLAIRANLIEQCRALGLRPYRHRSPSMVVLTIADLEKLMLFVEVVDAQDQSTMHSGFHCDSFKPNTMSTIPSESSAQVTADNEDYRPDRCDQCSSEDVAYPYTDRGYLCHECRDAMRVNRIRAIDID